MVFDIHMLLASISRHVAFQEEMGLGERYAAAIAIDSGTLVFSMPDEQLYTLCVFSEEH